MQPEKTLGEDEEAQSAEASVHQRAEDAVTNAGVKVVDIVAQRTEEFIEGHKVVVDDIGSGEVETFISRHGDEMWDKEADLRLDYKTALRNFIFAEDSDCNDRNIAGRLQSKGA